MFIWFTAQDPSVPIIIIIILPTKINHETTSWCTWLDPVASDLSNSEIKSISELHLWLYITHQLTKTKIYIFMVNCGSSLRSSWIKEKVRQKMHLFWLSWLSLAGWESLVWRKKESLRENCGGDRSQVIMLHRGLVSVWGISVSLDVIHIPIISHYTYNELKSKFAK